MQAVVQTESMTKQYGDIVAVDRVDLEIEHGDRVALIGHPGSGKTTFLRLLVDLVHPTSGRARVGGFDSVKAPYQVRRIVGWTPADPKLPVRLTVGEVLDRAAEYKRSDPDTSIRSHVLPLIDVAPDDPILELDDDERFVVALITALQKQPDVLILDEPLAAAGRFRSLVADLITELPEHVTLIASARDLGLAELIDFRVLLLEHGRIIADGDLETLRRTVRQRTELAFDSMPSEAALRALPGVLDLAVQGSTARVLSVGPTEDLIEAARAVGLSDAVVHQPGLAELVADHTLLAARR